MIVLLLLQIPIQKAAIDFFARENVCCIVDRVLHLLRSGTGVKECGATGDAQSDAAGYHTTI